MKLRKKYLMTDMDGTLISDDHVVSKRNKDAIQRFVELGGRFSVATGRSEQLVPQFLEGIPVNFPCIFYNGAAVYDWKKKQFLHRETIPHRILSQLVPEFLDCYPEICLEVFNGGPIKFLNHNCVTDHYVATEKHEFQWKSVEECGDIIKLMCYGDPERLKQVSKLVSKYGDEINMTFSAPFYLEILPQNVSKGSALKWLCQHYEIPLEEVAFVGDFYNDLAAIQAAGLGACPSSAPEDIRVKADYVSLDNNHDCIADVIETCLLTE